MSELHPCDLVMKGGVTSGVVYPPLVTRLSRTHRFVRIGGASAGAIAAAMAAAAELERTRREAGQAPPGDGPAGFALLEAMPDALGSSLTALFAPRRDLRHHLGALMAVVDERGAAQMAGIARHVLAASGVWLAVGVLAAAALGVVAGVTGGPAAGVLAAVLVLLVSLIALGVRFVCVGLGRIVDNGYGLVRGLSEPGAADAPALTEWIVDTLDALAGQPGEAPVSWGDLWGPDASRAHEALRLGSPGRVVDPIALDGFAPVLDLRVMTTCLSLRRPYTFPFGTRIFHWCPDCWADWFPPRIVAHLRDHSAVARPQDQDVEGVRTPIPGTCRHHPATALRSLPAAPDLPLAVGVRLSLSFPGLISAVPLWVLDRYRAEGHWGWQEVWFSDGGLTSNFPLEFFDAPFPGRPTFGVTLEEPHPDFPEVRAFRPEHNNSGILGRVRPLTGAGSFVEAIIGVLVDWRDALTVPAAGNRDRVVEVRIPRGSGGLHLRMNETVIADISASGAAGAERLESFDWDNHRWIRYRTAAAGIGDLLHEARTHAAQYADLLAADDSPSYPLPPGRREALRQASEALDTAARQWAALGNPAHAGNVPTPRRVFRATPPT